jgi:hypothetical protein
VRRAYGADMNRTPTRRAAAGVLLLLAVAGCGNTAKHAAAPTTTATTAAAPATTTSSSPPASAPGALTGEAGAAAAGDIPDNQVFVAYRGSAFTIRYPEGWSQSGGDGKVTFRDKNNIVRVVIASGPPPTVASAAKELAALPGAHVKTPPTATTIDGVPAVKSVYTTTSAPNPVTGKRVTLLVDRYELGRAGRRATVDLGSPVGVDNVDAYRMMIQSFRLR